MMSSFLNQPVRDDFIELFKGNIEIEPNTVVHGVYCAERDATGLLINYYKKVKRNDFRKILSSMNFFTKADAARFVLCDSLRAEGILELLDGRKDTYLEAGSIHLLLHRLLAGKLSNEWHLLSKNTADVVHIYFKTQKIYCQ